MCHRLWSVKVSSRGPECQIMVKSVTNCVGSERYRLGVRPQRIDERSCGLKYFRAPPKTRKCMIVYLISGFYIYIYIYIYTHTHTHTHTVFFDR